VGDLYIVLSFNRIGDVLVSLLSSSAVDCGFEPEIITLVFAAKHTVLRSKSKD